MRTTVNIDDRLLAWAKDRSQGEGRTLGELIEEALQQLMLRPATPEAVPLPVFRGAGGFRPGVDPLSNRSLLDAVEWDAVELDAVEWDAVDDDPGGSGS
jgi:hypothetical protein